MVLIVINYRGALPRALLIEVLDSIQKVIFDLTDVKSKKLLLSLTSTSTCNFDRMLNGSVRALISLADFLIF